MGLTVTDAVVLAHITNQQEMGGGSVLSWISDFPYNKRVCSGLHAATL